MFQNLRSVVWLAYWCVVLALATPQAVAQPPQPQPNAQARIPWLDGKLDSALKSFAQARTNDEAATAFNAILAILQKSGSGDKTLYVLERDLPSSLDAVCRWVQRLTAKVPPNEVCPRAEGAPQRASTQRSGQELRELRLAEHVDCLGKSDLEIREACIWTRTDRSKLRYWIDRESFKAAHISAEVMTSFEEHLKIAIEDWVTACFDCNVRIEPASSLDKNDKFLFVVTYNTTDLDPCQWATSFHPYIGPRRDSGFYEFRVGALFFSYAPLAQRDANADKRLPREVCDSLTEAQVVGWKLQAAHTLRHEIGHILGYSHEQLSKETLDNCRDTLDDPGPARSSRDTGAGYDVKSVMHSTGCFYKATPDKPGSHFKLRGTLSTTDVKEHEKIYLTGMSP